MAAQPDPFARHKHESWKAGNARRAKYLEILAKDPLASIESVCAEVGVQPTTYRQWRIRFKDFAAKVDAMVATGLGDAKPTGASWGWDDKDPEQAGKSVGIVAGKLRQKRAKADMPFAQFRKTYFGFDSTWYQQRVVDAIESTEGGEVVMILLPPEHGKTTMVEDHVSQLLAKDPGMRIACISERAFHGRKMIARLKNRMADNGPCKQYVRDFGPFEPQKGPAARDTQAWAAEYFDVWRKGDSDERDYNMVAAGITSAIAGSRWDLAIYDDIQSLKSLNQSEAMLEVIRQDGLSRTGAFGRTIIIGTRVGPGDIYELLEESGIVDRTIRLPAIDHKGELLWPERYSQKNYDRMRKNVGEDAWLRNYQQAPRETLNNHFTQEVLDDCANPLRSVKNVVGPEWDGIIIGVDPGFGVNAIVAAAYSADELAIWRWRVDNNLDNNQAIADAVEALYLQIVDPMNRVNLTDIMLEDKAFQKGLLKDQAFLDLKARYGCMIKGHQTGSNKYDPMFGVPQMAGSMLRGKMTLPGADDTFTHGARTELDHQFKRWKPFVRGTRLTQDLVMASWFAWLRWQQKLPALVPDATTKINIGGVPYGGPTRVTVGGAVR